MQIMQMMFHDQTADVTYYADVTIFPHITSGQPLIAAFFSSPINMVF